MVDWASGLNLVSTVSVLGALVFAGLQVRSANRARAEQAAVAVVQAVQTETWMKSLRIWQHVPFGLTPEQIDALGDDVMWAIETYGVQVEMVAYMVFRGIVRLEVAEEMIGGAVTNFWQRFHGWIELDRRRTNSPRNYEWVQWLAERMLERGSAGNLSPAYIRYKHWDRSMHVE